ncbi:MAG: VanZ family protein [Oscillospiraceae bacterium]|nr:VanZ family protein [Oscillospiraceae bacterium]
MTKLRTDSNKCAYNKNSSAPVRNDAPEKKNRFFLFLMVILFVCYLIGVLYLVLGERLLNGESSRFHRVVNLPYWKQVRQHTQLIPFRTILTYASRLKKNYPLRRIAFINLAGNLVLFFPMGIFLPYFFPKLRNLFRCSAVLIFMICSVEITQVFTLLGACDVDDLILNYAGALCGFIYFCILDFIRRKFHAGRNPKS